MGGEMGGGKLNLVGIQESSLEDGRDSDSKAERSTLNSDNSGRRRRRESGTFFSWIEILRRSSEPTSTCEDVSGRWKTLGSVMFCLLRSLIEFVLSLSTLADPMFWGASEDPDLGRSCASENPRCRRRLLAADN